MVFRHFAGKPTHTQGTIPYVYSKVDELEKTPKVGSHQCVALLQHYAKLPNTALWKKGESVMEAGTMAKGTAIATFVNGKYQSLSTGNHAAFFISKDANGIWVMDQWAGEDKKQVSKRYITRKGKLSSGAFINPRALLHKWLGRGQPVRG